MENNQDKKSDQEKLIDIIRFLLKNWYYFAIIYVICGFLGILYLINATQIWNINAMVTLRQDASLLGGSLARASSLMSSFGLGSAGQETVEDETAKLSSHGNLRRVVKKYELNKLYHETKFWGFIKTDLFDTPPLILITDPATADTLSFNIKFAIKMEAGKATVTMVADKRKVGVFDVASFPATIETAWGKYTFEKSPFFEEYAGDISLSILYTSYDYMAQEYQKTVNIDFHNRTSQLISLNFECARPYFAKKIISETIDSYNNEYVEDKGLSTDKTLQYIDTQLAARKELLTGADTQIQSFKNSHNLTKIEADVQYYLTLSGELQSQLLKAETQLSIANIISEFIKDEKNKYVLIPFDLTMADVNMVAAITEYNKQLIRRNDALKGGNNQSVFIQSLNNLLDLQRENLAKSLNNIREGLQITLNNIRKKEGEFNSKLHTIPAVEKEYIALAREQEYHQAVYMVLLEMREQSVIRNISILPKLKIINAPYKINKRVAPRTLYTGITVIFAGFILSLMVIFAKPALKFLRENLKSPKEVDVEL
ncbi:MAG: hypothetical protein LBV41_07250 [Cytophagaceae bacterium]|nr:hypothetical protein [Cytophagaceae bacterium]